MWLNETGFIIRKTNTTPWLTGLLTVALGRTRAPCYNLKNNVVSGYKLTLLIQTLKL